MNLTRKRHINQECKTQTYSLDNSCASIVFKYTTPSNRFRDKGLLCEGNCVVTRARLTLITHNISTKPVIPL